jgi:hypothetical protein
MHNTPFRTVPPCTLKDQRSLPRTEANARRLRKAYGLKHQRSLMNAHLAMQRIAGV